MSIVQLLDKSLSLVSPHICKNCGRLGDTYCTSCIFDTIKRDYPICLYCGKKCKTNNLCEACRRQHKLFNELVAVADRAGSLRRLVGDYKFNSQVASCRPLAKLIAGRVGQLSPQTVVVPIPTISAHIRQRGFDHMRLVARELGEILGLQVDSCILGRADNVSQHNLGRSDRRKLIKQSIVARRTNNIPESVLLIDDIWTTGATLETAATVLRKLGVQHVIVVAILMQPKHKK